MLNIEPVTLTGKIVRLEPLQLHHAPDLFLAGQDESIWRYLPENPSHSLAAMQRWIQEALQLQAEKLSLPFAIIDINTKQAIGSTRFHVFTMKDRGTEIGWTWLSPIVQRTGVNTECKYLLLRHAFEIICVIRVQLKTHHKNSKSQRAIERIGASKEGVLRNHMIMPDGSYRHSVFYSILDHEWPAVKTALEAKMNY